MYGKVKLSKRQIKEDKFTTFMLKAKHQLHENWQFYVIGVVVVILSITAAVYYVNILETKDNEAGEQFSRALLDYRNGNNQVAIMSFNQIIDEYPGNKVAEQSTFLLGKVNLESKNYSEAIRYFEIYLDKYREDKMNRSAVYAGIASCYENQGKYLEAAQEFKAAYDEYPDGPLIGDYLISTMRNYLLVGEVEKARALLEKIKDLFSGTDLEARSIRLFFEKSRT
ncbi:MAG: tetratricopeptide repeat protein [Candidatus Zixiibacteriota bacterium]